MPILWHRLRRVLASEEELTSEQRSADALRSGATLIADAVPRTQVVLQGNLASMTINPVGENRWLEGELHDGSGAVRLVWMGRRVVAGVRVGLTLRVTGMLTEAGGQPVIYNPEYSIIA